MNMVNKKCKRELFAVRTHSISVRSEHIFQDSSLDFLHHNIASKSFDGTPISQDFDEILEALRLPMESHAQVVKPVP